MAWAILSSSCITILLVGMANPSGRSPREGQNCFPKADQQHRNLSAHLHLKAISATAQVFPSLDGGWRSPPGTPSPNFLSPAPPQGPASRYNPLAFSKTWGRVCLSAPQGEGPWKPHCQSLG